MIDVKVVSNLLLTSFRVCSPSNQVHKLISGFDHERVNQENEMDWIN